MTTIEIPLYRRGVVTAFALVDATDADDCAQHRWRVSRWGYAIRGGGNQQVLMHRQLLGLTRGDGLEVDHKNGNRLDCRRSNMRVVTHAQNQQNRSYGYGTSRFRGVSFDSARKRWNAHVKLGGRTRMCGRFDTEEEAARAAAYFRRKHMPFTVEQPIEEVTLA